MAYNLFDIKGKDLTPRDLQNKGLWCKSGASKEEVFIEQFGQDLHLIINPEKRNNPYVPDLYNTANGLLADLKTQNTPFFQARSRFDLDPQYTVVFNGKDRERYRSKYPKIEIYFAVDWQAVEFRGHTNIKVNPMTGIWFVPFPSLHILLEKAPLHAYGQRKFDQKGNARASFVLDLRDDIFTKVA